MMNNTRDGKMCLRAQRGRVNYFPSARDNAAVSAAAAAVASAAGAAGVCPVTGQSGSLPPIPQPNDPQAFSTAPQPMPEGAVKIRERPPSFQDHFSQARLFWRSLSEWERAHTVAAFTFELGNVTSTEIRSNVVHRVLCRIDDVLARAVAARIGVHIDEERARAPMQRLPGAGPNTEAAAPGSEAAEAAARAEKACPRSEALSMDRPPPTLDGRTVGAVVGDGASARQVRRIYVNVTSTLDSPGTDFFTRTHVVLSLFCHSSVVFAAGGCRGRRHASTGHHRDSHARHTRWRR
jgi:catalase